MESPPKGYPLQWPVGWQRTGPGDRKYGHFGKREKKAGNSWTTMTDITLADATRRVLDELSTMRIAARDIVISTMFELRNDGLPRSGQRKPSDPGAAVYWIDQTRKARVVAIDQYTTTEDNLAAIAATLSALRAVERHGGAKILERAFVGFDALPNPDAPSQGPHWRQVLGLPPGTPSKEMVTSAYRLWASKLHPDKGGSNEQMAQLNKAREDALREIGEA